ncbi:MAG: hypothetical protein ABSB70_04055 [Candidatus Velthaea sp.]|jgi:hypothetical protein
MYKNIAATLQIVERARRESRAGTLAATAPSIATAAAGARQPAPGKLGPMQKIVAFGPLP